jgi:hypothetical protein
MPNVYQRSADQTVYPVANPGGPGIGNVGSYQVSGIPYITGSSALGNNTEHYHLFPNVTKNISVFNQGAKDIKIHFVSKDKGAVYAEHHFLTLSGSNGDSVDSNRLDLDVKCSEIYISNNSGGTAAYELIASLTTINRGQMFSLTGSGISTKTDGGSNAGAP